MGMLVCGCRYTREAGVRSLERKIAAICRAVAVKVAEGQGGSAPPSTTTKEESDPEPPAEQGGRSVSRTGA